MTIIIIIISIALWLEFAHTGQTRDCDKWRRWRRFKIWNYLQFYLEVAGAQFVIERTLLLSNTHDVLWKFDRRFQLFARDLMRSTYYYYHKLLPLQLGQHGPFVNCHSLVLTGNCDTRETRLPRNVLLTILLWLLLLLLLSIDKWIETCVTHNFYYYYY